MGVIGPSRAAVLVGVSPVLSAAIAVTLLGEPLHVALVLGTLLVVVGGTLLVQERGGRSALLSLGIALGLGAALLFAIRDNLVRWAARGNEVPGFVAASASLVSASLVIWIIVALRPDAGARVRRASRPFLLSGLVYGVSYACLYSAFDRGRVTAPRLGPVRHHVAGLDHRVAPSGLVEVFDSPDELTHRCADLLRLRRQVDAALAAYALADELGRIDGSGVAVEQRAQDGGAA